MIKFVLTRLRSHPYVWLILTLIALLGIFLQLKSEFSPHEADLSDMAVDRIKKDVPSVQVFKLIEDLSSESKTLVVQELFEDYIGHLGSGSGYFMDVARNSGGAYEIIIAGSTSTGHLGLKVGPFIKCEMDSTWREMLLSLEYDELIKFRGTILPGYGRRRLILPSDHYITSIDLKDCSVESAQNI